MALERTNLMFLMEIKNKRSTMVRLRQQLKFKKSIIIDSIAITGGMVIMWEEAGVGTTRTRNRLDQLALGGSKGGLVLGGSKGCLSDSRFQGKPNWTNSF